MRAFIAAILLAAAFPAAAQLVKCVDEKGRTHYTDKPASDCKGAKSQKEIAPAPVPEAKAAPKPAAPKPQARRPDAPQAKAPAKKPMTEQEARWQASNCKSNQDLLDLLNSEAGANIPNREARLGWIKRAMQDCK